jgi:hypothetical protein
MVELGPIATQHGRLPGPMLLLPCCAKRESCCDELTCAGRCKKIGCRVQLIPCRHPNGEEAAEVLRQADAEGKAQGRVRGE